MSRKFKTKGSKRKIDNSNKRAEVAIGYCNYKLHKGFITIPAAQCHKCVEKQCPHFTLFEEYYWVDRQAKRIFKRIRKAHNKGEILQEDFVCYADLYANNKKTFVKSMRGTHYFWEDNYCIIKGSKK